MKLTIAMLIIIVIGVLYWYNIPTYIQPNDCKIEDIADPERIEKAILKMGPYYNYTIDPDGTLKVNKGDGKWLILKY